MLNLSARSQFPGTITGIRKGVTAVLGTPLFLWLMVRARRGGAA